MSPMKLNPSFTARIHPDSDIDEDITKVKSMIDSESIHNSNSSFTRGDNNNNMNISSSIALSEEDSLEENIISQSCTRSVLVYRR